QIITTSARTFMLPPFLQQSLFSPQVRQGPGADRSAAEDSGGYVTKLPLAVISPTDHRAVTLQSACVEAPSADLREGPAGDVGELPFSAHSPTDHRAVTLHPAGV